MDSKYFFQNCPAPIIGLAGFHSTTTAAMLQAIFQAHFNTTSLGDKVHLVATTANPEYGILRDTDTLSDISNIDIVIYILSNEQLADLAVALPRLVISQTTDDNTNIPVVRSTNLHATKTFFLGRDLNSYALANRTLAQSLVAYPDDLAFSLPTLKVVGVWQYECAAAAAIAASDFNLLPELIQHALANFDELPHHLDFIREINGVKYYDDGNSTTPELAETSIKTFTQPIVISTHHFPDNIVKRQIIIQPATNDSSIVSDPLIDRADNLADATELASILAVAGDTVLYVPATNLPSENFVMEVNKIESSLNENA
ncbi:MAG: hypothetical protein LBM12_02800 [Candidatus Nomurabacteria bacterium]|jgi:hypothetical protein|nr:hypothetical protein [Candidatus Nomurabacteria bacterium]